MNKLFFTICGMLFFAFQIVGQGIDFFHGTWQEALEKAAAEEKIIFVDAYAVWCGPCKRMAKNVFTNPKVGEFYNANFVNLKLDMERGEGLNFRAKYPVSAFPTLFYINAQGEVLRKVKGAQTIENFIKLGESVLPKIDHSKSYVEEYEKGNRDPEFMYKYIQSLNKSNKPSLKVANDYLNDQTDLTTAINQKIIFESTTEADSRIFDLLINNRKNIEKLMGKEAVNEKIKKACLATVQKAIEFESEFLLDEVKEKMKLHLPKQAQGLTLRADLDFCLAMGDSNKYLKCCSDYVKKEVKNDGKELHQLAQKIEENFKNDEKAMKQAEKLAKRALDTDKEMVKYHLTYASILDRNGKKSEALKVANKSIEIAQKQGGDIRAIQKLIKRIEG